MGESESTVAPDAIRFGAEDDWMAELKCPKCGNVFVDVPCRQCKGVVKGYICSKCGEKVPNPSWKGEQFIWVKSDMTNEWRKKGATIVEDKTVDAMPEM